MIPIKKPWTNITMGEGQSHVLPCPAYRDERTGEITIAWELTEEEVEEITKNKTLLMKVFTYGRPIQPLQLWVEGQDGKAIKDDRI